MQTNADKMFLEHYEKYKDKIFNYFWYRVNFNRATAEDLTSEVFLKAFEKFDRYDQRRPFQPWIFAIAHNHLVNFYKISGRQTPLENLLPVFEAKEEDPNIHLDAEIVIKEINDLPDYQKDVLIMRYVNGLSNQEIAEALDKDESAIRVAIHRALNLLKEKIDAKNN